MARLPNPDAPAKLQINDVVECSWRQKYVPWIVRECWPNEGLGTQTVIASHPGRGAVRFTWYGARSENRLGVGSGTRNATKYYFVSRPEPEVLAPPSATVEVLPFDVWRYKSGIDYRVLFVANTRNESDKHPPAVVYETLRDPTAKWTRPLSDWHRSFTLQNRKT